MLKININQLSEGKQPYTFLKVAENLLELVKPNENVTIFYSKNNPIYLI
jgi:hypothetical protein